MNAPENLKRRLKLEDVVAAVQDFASSEFESVIAIQALLDDGHVRWADANFLAGARLQYATEGLPFRC